MLQQAGQPVPDFKPDLQINPHHPLVKRIADCDDDAERGELAHILLDEALLVDGGDLGDPAAFVRRINRLLTPDAGSK